MSSGGEAGGAAPTPGPSAHRGGLTLFRAQAALPANGPLDHVRRINCFGRGNPIRSVSSRSGVGSSDGAESKALTRVIQTRWARARAGRTSVL